MSITLTRPDPTPVTMIERMTLILDAFDVGTPTLTLLDLVERTGLPRSTVHRILDQMIRLRWLAHAAGGYRLGLRPLELGGLAGDHHEIRDAVNPVLHELCLRTGLVGHLAVLDGHDVVYLAKVGGRNSAKVPTRLGGRRPAHSTALGKAILAGVEPAVVDAAFHAHLPKLTPRTIGDSATLRRELALIRQRHGVALDNQESVPGISCIAAPIVGRHARAHGFHQAPVAAISLCAPTGTLPTERLGRVIVEAAHEAARMLGPTRPAYT